jgi:signal transduction histidine kinase
MNTIPCSLLLLNEQGIIQECTPEASKLFLKNKDEIINKNIAYFVPALATLDGEFDTETALKNMEETLLAPNFDNPYIEFSGRRIAIKESISYLLTISDINEKKHSQKALSALNQQLVNAEKLASIGQLSAGIAHEINNPVGYIRSNLDMLADYIKPLISYLAIVNTAEQKESAKALYQEEDLDYILNDIEPLIASSLEGTIRISKIIKDLGNYAHVGNKEPELIIIDKLLEQSLALAANELKYKVEIVKCLDANVNIMGFPQKLLQVFINMLVNASHAITSNGRISIRSCIEHDEINISFEDNGSGISATHLKNIFDPFFTTKPVGKGTGLGLHIVRSIIDDHNGRIDVSSIIGKGSTFNIYLPIHKAIK